VFADVNGLEVVGTYGDLLAEHSVLRDTVGVMDLSHRSRVCLTGADRVRFLNGQVTNNIKVLSPGTGCYAALVTAKGKMQSDLHVHCLQDELLLDFEPGLTSKVTARLEAYIVADDVQVVDLHAAYGLLSVQGPRAAAAVQQMAWLPSVPPAAYDSVTVRDSTLGECVVVNLPRLGTQGYDLFVPEAASGVVLEQLVAAARARGGAACGWQALEMRRIEVGLPRFGQDMDETNIPLEAGLEDRAVRYNKGCYIGQEVINRIHSIGQVAKALRGLLLPDGLPQLPACGDKLLQEGREVGYITSALMSPTLNKPIALGYVRREVNKPGTTLTLASTPGNLPVQVVSLPFGGEPR
jgi:folate-binding protein YgfZ